MRRKSTLPGAYDLSRKIKARLRGSIWAAFIGTMILSCPVEAGKKEHLKFFRANRDFILRAFERQPADDSAAGNRTRNWDFDPFEEWSATQAVTTVQTQLDSAQTLEQLGEFHASLDGLLERAGQAAERLDDLDYRFATHLRTSLEVTLEMREKTSIARVEAWLDGEQLLVHLLDTEEIEALQSGGILEVLRTAIEPRTQKLELVVYLSGRTEPLRFEQQVRPQPDALLRTHINLDDHNARFKLTLLEGR